MWRYELEFLGNVFTHEFFVGDVSSIADGHQWLRNFSIKNDLHDITVMVDCIERFEGKIFLTELSGKTIGQTSYHFNEGNNIIRMNTGKLPRGLYMVSLASEKGTFLETEKFIR